VYVTKFEVCVICNDVVRKICPTCGRCSDCGHKPWCNDNFVETKVEDDGTE